MMIGPISSLLKWFFETKCCEYIAFIALDLTIVFVFIIFIMAILGSWRAFTNNEPPDID